MNNVHLVTQEKKTSQNGSKMGRVHRVHCPRPTRVPSAQAARPAPRPRSAARPSLPPALPAPRLRAQRPVCMPSAPPARSASALRAQPAPSTIIHLSHNTQSVSRHTWAVAQFYFFCTKNLFFFIIHDKFFFSLIPAV